jgi:uncharacterized protein (TIRG00374 family)
LAVLFGAHGLTLPIGAGFRVVAIGALFNMWIPGGTGGDVMKLYYLAVRFPGRKVEVATLILADRAAAFFALLLLLAGLLLAQPDLLARGLIRTMAIIVTVALAVIVVAGLVLGSRRLNEHTATAALFARLPLGRYLARAARAAHELTNHRVVVLKAIALSLAGHGLLALMLGVTGTVLLPGVPALTASTLTLLSLVANVLPLTPGGLGVGETASEVLFSSIGVAGGAALVAAWRAGTILISVCGAVFYARGERSAPLADA